MAKRDCAAQVFNYLNEKGIKLGKKDAEMVLDAVEKRMRSYPDATPNDPRWAEAAQSIIEDIRRAAWAAKRNKKLQLVKAADLDVLTQSALNAGASFADARMAATVGATTRFDGSTRSAAAMKDAIFAENFNGLMGELKAHPLGDLNREFSTFFKVDHQKQKDLALALEKQSNPDAPGTKNEKANAAAAIIHKYRRNMFKRRNRAGAYAKELPGFVGSQTHDAYKIGDLNTPTGIKAREQWLEDIIPAIDDRTWHEQGIDLDDLAAKVEWLNGAADNIIGGKPDYEFGKSDFEFKPTGTLAKTISSKHRKIHFKDASHWFEYNKKYGKSQSVTETLISDMQHMASEISLMERFGPDPKAAWDSWEKRTQAKHAKGRGAKELEKMGRATDKWYFDSLFPEADAIQSKSLAVAEQLLLSFNNLGKLSLVTVSSLTDFMFQGVALRRLTNGGLTHSYQSIYKSFKRMSKDEQDMMDSALGYMQEGMIANMSSRTDPTGDFSGKIQKANNMFFWLNGLQGWTRHQKRKMGHAVTGYFGMNAKKSYGELDDHLRQILKQGGIFEEQWDALRQALWKSSTGREFIVPGMVRDLPDSAFTDASKSVDAQKDELVTKFNVLVNSFVESGVPTPGARERAELRLWQKKGTWTGLFMKAMTQFKSFPLTVWNKIIMPMFRDKHTRADFDGLGLAMIIGESILFGGAVLAMKDVIKGRVPEAYVAAEKFDEEPSASVKYVIQSMLQGGALSLYGDLLMQDYTRFGTSFGGQLAGPTVATTGRFLKEFAAAMRGEGDPASALRALQDNTPFINYPGVRTGIDYLVGYMLQEYLNPGYVRRMESYQERENRPFMLPPSQYAVGV